MCESYLCAFFAVVDDDLVILGAGDKSVAVGREVYAVDSVGVLAEHLGDLEATHNLVNELHLDDRGGVFLIAPRLVGLLPRCAPCARRRLVHLGPRDFATGRHNREDARARGQSPRASNPQLDSPRVNLPTC